MNIPSIGEYQSTERKKVDSLIISNNVMGHSRSHISGHSQPVRPTTSALPYNAAHYSPKAATFEPTHSSFLARETARELANRTQDTCFSFFFSLSLKYRIIHRI